MNSRAVEFFNGLPAVMPQVLRITLIDICRFVIKHQQDQLAPFQLWFMKWYPACPSAAHRETTVAGNAGVQAFRAGRGGTVNSSANEMKLAIVFIALFDNNHYSCQHLIPFQAYRQLPWCTAMNICTKSLQGTFPDHVSAAIFMLA